MRTRLSDGLSLRDSLLLGLLPGAGLSLYTVLIWGKPLSILGALYYFLCFWAFWTIPFAVLFGLTSGAISVVIEWRENRRLQKEVRRYGLGHRRR
jgi:hypothetical protein